MLVHQRGFAQAEDECFLDFNLHSERLFIFVANIFRQCKCGALHPRPEGRGFSAQEDKRIGKIPGNLARRGVQHRTASIAVLYDGDWTRPGPSSLTRTLQVEQRA